LARGGKSLSSTRGRRLTKDVVKGEFRGRSIERKKKKIIKRKNQKELRNQSTRRGSGQTWGGEKVPWKNFFPKR